MYISCSTGAWLAVCHDVVNLQGVPAIDDGQDKDKADDDPVSYQCICFIVIPSKDLVESIAAVLHFHLYTSWVRMQCL